jgi:hypothetical protein
MPLPAGFQGIGLIVHRAAIAGRVLDGLARSPLAGATVTITSGPKAFMDRVAALKQGRPDATPDRVLTSRDGFFRWLDLPAGAYALGASLPGAGTRYAAVVTGNVQVVAQGPCAMIDLTLAPTTLVGVIQRSSPAGPLPLARVRFIDSGESSFSDASGAFTLSPVEAGAGRTLELSAQGFVTAKLAVTLTSGSTTTAAAVTLVNS